MVAFFLHQQDIHETDLSNLLNRSYRLGGSEYEILLVSYLIEMRDNGIQSFLLSNYAGILPHQKFCYVDNLEQACEFCVNNSIDQMVIDIKQFKEKTIDKYAKRMKFFVWAHNIVGEYQLNKCLTYSCVKKIICVSQSQMLEFHNHPSILKACYIYNIILFRDKKFYEKKIRARNQHNVVYMGCLRPDKGFHALAKAWPKVLEGVPDAHLYVIGNGQLYGRNVELGRYGIASQEYEDEFMGYLTDNTGRILPSVHFMGLMGDEKFDVMGMCKVGVPNPTDSSETFCISGVEMELMGCSVSTLKLPVYEETQMNTNYLFDDEALMPHFIIRRLKEEPDSFEDLYEFVTTKFDLEKSLSRWECLIKSNDVESIGKMSRLKRTIKIIVAKYYFLFFTQTLNFLRYRIKHHIFGGV